MKVVKVEKGGKAQIMLSMTEDEALEVCAALLCGCMCREHIHFALAAIRGIKRNGITKEADAAIKSGPIGNIVVETVMLIDDSKLQ